MMCVVLPHNLIGCCCCLCFRTETVVEKMLTNWMSICLYSFLKVSVRAPDPDSLCVPVVVPLTRLCV